MFFETANGALHRFEVELADDPETRRVGLMHRDHLPDDRAMLFDFKRVRPVAMWMRNTLIPLDIVFVAPDGRIVRIARETTPMSDDQIPSGEPVLAVVEIAGGRAAKIGLKPGDHVRHRIFGD